MKQASKNEADMLSLISKMQEQLVTLDKKIDTLLSAKPSVQNAPPAVKPQHDHNKTRQMYTAICADCRKECKIPFKPSGDRPVYCQDCFSRRKVISMSGMKVETPQASSIVKASIAPQVKTKKKAVAVKKTVTKKKITPKKK